MFKSTLINSTLKHFSASICSDTKRQIPLMRANKHSEQQRDRKKTNKNNGEIDWRYNMMNALEIGSCHPAKLLSPPTDGFCWFALVLCTEYLFTVMRMQWNISELVAWAMSSIGFTQCFGFLSTSSVKTNTQGPSQFHTHNTFSLIHTSVFPSCLTATHDLLHISCSAGVDIFQFHSICSGWVIRWCPTGVREPMGSTSH